MGNYDVKFDILECAREERVRGAVVVCVRQEHIFLSERRMGSATCLLVVEVLK